MRLNINKTAVESALIGGAILGGGGGGWLEEGEKMARLALENGFSEILPLDSLDPSSLLLTVSAVGAPSAGYNQLLPEDYLRAVELFLEKSQAKISGLISSEIGGLAIVNGWVQSVFLGIPVVDAPADGRAHPLGLMGSMGLHKIKDYISQQAVVGRTREGKLIETFLVGSIEETARTTRELAAELSGLVAVARHPVEASYVRDHGAPGAIGQAISLGQLFKEKHQAGLDSQKIVASILDFLGEGNLFTGQVNKYSLWAKEGFDLGLIQIESSSGEYELTFWNEYMTLEKKGERLATFPDLIMTFEAETARPLISAAVKEGMEIIILSVPAQRLLLGAGVKDPVLLKKIEAKIDREILKYHRYLM
jgi:DUF917 family protein